MPVGGAKFLRPVIVCAPESVTFSSWALRPHLPLDPMDFHTHTTPAESVNSCPFVEAGGKMIAGTMLNGWVGGDGYGVASGYSGLAVHFHDCFVDRGGSPHLPGDDAAQRPRPGGVRNWRKRRRT